MKYLKHRSLAVAAQPGAAQPGVLLRSDFPDSPAFLRIYHFHVAHPTPRYALDIAPGAGLLWKVMANSAPEPPAGPPVAGGTVHAAALCPHCGSSSVRRSTRTRKMDRVA